MKTALTFFLFNASLLAVLAQCPSYSLPSNYTLINTPVIDLNLGNSWDTVNGTIDITQTGTKSGYILTTIPPIDMTVDVIVTGTTGGGFGNPLSMSEIKGGNQFSLQKNSSVSLSFKSTLTGTPIYLLNTYFVVGDFESGEVLSEYSVNYPGATISYGNGFWSCFTDHLGVEVDTPGSLISVDMSGGLTASYSFAPGYQTNKTAQFPVSYLPISSITVSRNTSGVNGRNPVLGFPFGSNSTGALVSDDLLNPVNVPISSRN
jgi:hypothetical protein